MHNQLHKAGKHITIIQHLGCHIKQMVLKILRSFTFKHFFFLRNSFIADYMNAYLLSRHLPLQPHIVYVS